MGRSGEQMPANRRLHNPTHNGALTNVQDTCALAVAVLVAGPSSASETAGVMAPVHQFIDGFNKGDIRTALAACADQTSIIDEFLPHEWHGAGACSNWANDFDADAKKNGITDGIVTLGSPPARRYHGRPCLCRRSRELHVQAEGEAGQGDRLDAYACPAERRGRLAHHRMGMDEEVSAAALTLNI